MVKMNRSIFKKSKLKKEGILKKSKSVKGNKKTKRVLGMCSRRTVKRVRAAGRQRLRRKARKRTMGERGAAKEGRGEKRRREDVNINIKVTVEPEKRRGLKRKSLGAEEGTGVTTESAGVTKEGRESAGVTKKGIEVSTEMRNISKSDSVVNKLEEGGKSFVETREAGGRPSILKKEDVGSVEDGKSTQKTFKIIKKDTSEGERGSGHFEEKESEKSMRGSEERKKNESSFKNQREKPSENIEKLINKKETLDQDNSVKETKVPKSTSTTHGKVNKKVEDITESSTIDPLKRISSLNVKDNASTKEHLPRKLDINEKQSPSTFKVVKEHPYESKTPILENSESSKDKGKDKNKKLCKKEPSCKRDNKSIFAEDCDICSKINNGKNKSNSTIQNKDKRNQGLKDENLFGTPKTKYRKE